MDYAQSSSKTTRSSCASVPQAGTPSYLPERGEIERMARRRCQRPKVFKEGNFWWILIRQDEFKDGGFVRRKKRLHVAPADTLKREAQKLADAMVSPMNLGEASTIGGATPFGVFVDEVYKHQAFKKLRVPTQNCYGYMLNNHLLPVFRHVPLNQMEAGKLTSFFCDLKVPIPTKRKVADVLRSVLGNAAELNGYLPANPMHKVKVERPPRKKKPTITPAQSRSLLDLISEPYATMVYTCVMAGLRVSELIGLRWRDIGTNALMIDERFCRGDWGPTKTDDSTNEVTVDHTVIERIHALKSTNVTVNWGGRGAKKTIRVVRRDGPDDLVFQSLRSGSPMSDHNILVRHIKPAARKLGLGFVNWQVFRRSLATWMYQAGIHPKAAQGQLRHASIETTMNIYTQLEHDTQREAVSTLSNWINRKVEPRDEVVM